MSAQRIQTLLVGDALPSRDHTPTNVSLFLYNAAVWNPHRIHYDEKYTTEIEGHPGVVVDGPLQGDWLAQVVVNWLGEDGQMEQFEFSNRRASHLGDTLTSGGNIKEIDIATSTVKLDLFIKNNKGEIITPGSAVVRFS